MSCSAVFCSSRTTLEGVKTPELSFHKFPKCPEIRNQWIKAVRRDNWEPSKYSRLCSKHFEDSCYITGLSLRKLKSDAVPTIFEGYPKYYQPKLTKKRKAPMRPEVTLKSENLEIDSSSTESMHECLIKTDDIPAAPRRAKNIVKLLQKSRMVASRRLKVLKSLRESNRRLVKRNTELFNIINYLQTKQSIKTESPNVLSSTNDQHKDLLPITVPLQPKKSPELKKFALIFHFMSPEKQ